MDLKIHHFIRARPKRSLHWKTYVSLEGLVRRRDIDLITRDLERQEVTWSNHWSRLQGDSFEDTSALILEGICQLKNTVMIYSWECVLWSTSERTGKLCETEILKLRVISVGILINIKTMCFLVVNPKWYCFIKVVFTFRNVLNASWSCTCMSFAGRFNFE